MTGYDRQFEVPARLRGSDRSPARLTAWELAHLDKETTPAPVLDWAEKVVQSVITAAAAPGTEAATDCTDCDDTGFYGQPDEADPDILRALYRRHSQGYETLQADGRWVGADPGGPVELLGLDVAQDLASAVLAGGSGLVRRYFTPLAFLPPRDIQSSSTYPAVLLAAPTAPAGPAGAPKPGAPAAPTDDGNTWNTYAIVDPLDTGAVLNVIRLRPGPVMERYDKGGTWVPDPPVLASLTGLDPPPLVELDPPTLTDVLKQVDSTAATATTAAGLDAKSRQKAADKGTARPDGSFPIRNRDELSKAVHALGRAQDKDATKRHIIKRARALNAVSALPEDWGITADAATHHSANPNAAKLRRYWTTGEGALKIRWSTPGDFGRCYTHLKKFLGERAKPYCAQIHKDATGMWPGSKANRASGALMAMAVSTEESLVASIGAGTWMGMGGDMVTEFADGIYEEQSSLDSNVVRALTAGAFPVVPPHEWFQNPQLSSLTPTVVEPNGRVFGHMADWQRAHIGLPGRVPPPRSASGYRYFATGLLNTLKADGSQSAVPVGQLTLVGGHASMKADAGQAVKHYDDTNSAVADVTVGEDQHGIWFAGSLRPNVSPEQLRTFMASSLSGDWRPINGHLELVACCSVNVPGFPIARARVAGGAVMALTAAGAVGVALKRVSRDADAALAARVEYLEAMVAAILEGEAGVVVGDEVPDVADTDYNEPAGDPEFEADPEAETVEQEEPDETEPAEVPKAVARARQKMMERRAGIIARAHRTTVEEELAKLVAASAAPVTAAFKLEDWMAPTGSDGTVVKTGQTVAVSSKSDESVAVGKVIDVSKRGIKVKWTSGKTGTATIGSADIATLVRVTADKSADTKTVDDTAAAAPDAAAAPTA